MKELLRCLRLYAPALVLVVLAVLVQFVPESPAWIATRLVVLAVALAISVHARRG